MNYDLKSKIRDINDFPQAGIVFRDITTLLKDGEIFSYTIDRLKELIADIDFDIIVGPESRGFIIGTPLAYATKKGFIPVRKPGKLPAETTQYSYDLEYGKDILEIHIDAIEKGQKVLIADDLLATGGTIFSTIKLIEELGGEVAGIVCLIELLDLNARKMLENYNVKTLIQY